MTTTVLDIDDLAFSYGERPVLQLPSLSLRAGESCAVLGPSGCGKTTLMHLIAGLLRPQRGTITVAGQSLAGLGAAGSDRFRGRHLGIVFQRLHLLPALSVLDNLLLAQRFAGAKLDARAARALLAQLDVDAHARAKPASLSQGQAQRVAIARALVHRPRLVIADEPTSSLDDDNAQRALDLLRSQTQAIDAALLVVTHDGRIRGQLDRELRLGRAS